MVIDAVYQGPMGSAQQGMFGVEEKAEKEKSLGFTLTDKRSEP